MKRIIWILTILAFSWLIGGCGDDNGDVETLSNQIEAPKDKFTRPQNKYTPEGGASRFEGKGFTPQQIDDLIEIEANMTEALIRWSYRDKAALYDNELEYIQDRFTLPEYLGQSRIKAANSADSIVGYYVTGGEFFGRDSVIVDDVVVFIGLKGNQINFVNKDKLYYRRGRWVRPTMGKMQAQLDYERLILQADSAAAAEEDEGY